MSRSNFCARAFYIDALTFGFGFCPSDKALHLETWGQTVAARTDENRIAVCGLAASREYSRFTLCGLHGAPIASFVPYGEVNVQIPGVSCADVRRYSAPTF